MCSPHVSSWDPWLLGACSHHEDDGSAPGQARQHKTFKASPYIILANISIGQIKSSIQVQSQWDGMYIFLIMNLGKGCGEGRKNWEPIHQFTTGTNGYG